MSSSWEDVGVAVASMVLATFSMFDKPENVFLITFTGAPCFPISAIASPNSPTVEANFCRIPATLSTLDDGIFNAATGGSTVPLPNDPALFSSLTLFLASSALQPTMVGFLNDSDNDYKGGFEKSDVDQLLFNIETNFDQWTSGFANVAVGPKDPLSVEYLEKSFKKMGAQVGLAMAKAIFFSDYRSVLEKVTVQCTLIHTEVDFAVPPEVATFMHQNIRGEATIKVVEGEGHFPQLTAHEQFLKAVFAALT
nr:strigolactone esterase D14 [Ipomoea batatas]GME09400.1 strigolactone esterase D14 [Ipomoea batatas]